MLVIGAGAILTAHGWTQECPEGADASVCTTTGPLVEGLTSPGLGILAWGAILIGIAAVVLVLLRARQVPNKQAREAAIAGAVIGVQAAALAGVLLWFRSSNVEVFTRNFLDIRLFGEFFPRFVNGAKNTLILSVLGGALGMFLGLIIALFSMSKRAAVRAPARLYINFFRGTPLIWQLSFAGLGVVTGSASASSRARPAPIGWPSPACSA